MGGGRAKHGNSNYCKRSVDGAAKKGSKPTGVKVINPCPVCQTEVKSGDWDAHVCRTTKKV